MQNSKAVIIHISLIVQQGLKNILLSGNIGISDIMSSLPENGSLGIYTDSIIFVDIQLACVLKKQYRLLKKNRNTIIAIATVRGPLETESVFDDVLYINDSASAIFRKISDNISKSDHPKTGNQLTHRETEILVMVANGFSSKLIADKLFISIHTVITHRKNITTKLGIKSISGLTLYAALNNMIESR